MLTVKLEQMYPTREFIDCVVFDDRNKQIDTVSREVEQYINRRMWEYKEKFPLMTELRWEYEQYGQGHYLPVDDGDFEPPITWVGKLDYGQMIDVLKKATELNDWATAELAAYQLKLSQSRPYVSKSWAEFVLSFDDYDFDWMYDDSQCLMTNEEFIAEEERLAGKIEEVTDDRVVCSRCGKVAESHEAMIASGEYGQLDVIVCIECVKELNDDEDTPLSNEFLDNFEEYLNEDK